MELNIITTNKGKIDELRTVLEPEFKINHIDEEYLELKSDDPEEIARESAERLTKKYKMPVVTEDSGLFIKALKDFPGTSSKYAYLRIGLKGLLQLMEGIVDRTCHYKSALAYCEPGKKPISFLGTEEGTIADKERGKFGFGHDPIFIPKGSKKTYGEMEKCETFKRFRKKAAKKLRDYIKKEAR